MSKKERLDTLIVEKGILPNRQIARSAIMDGGILVNGVKETKPGTLFLSSASIELSQKWQSNKYVSRGGLKLEAALAKFAIDVTDRICLDVGASTGGFTDCLLQAGAKHVYAVDVGYGQLDWKLRNDERVTIKEKINARHLSPDIIYKENVAWANFCVMDVSFISILKVLPACLTVLAPEQEFVCLIKPQFEIGKGLIGKGGVVKNKEQHIKVISDVVADASQLGLKADNLTYSPVVGPAGNIEFLVRFIHGDASKIEIFDHKFITEIVDEAHGQLLKKQTE